MDVAHIQLDANESVALIGCLMNAAELSERAGNLELAARALYMVDLIIDRWIEARGRR
jgi:hypothetical protein